MRDDELGALVQKAIDEHIFPGCVVGVFESGQVAIRAFGTPTYESDIPILADSIYDVASLTKTIVTATLMHLLLDAGHCNLKDPVSKYIPEFAANDKEGVLIEHALSYTLSLSYTYTDNWQGDTTRATFAGILKMICEAPLKTVPGEEYLYTDATAVLLGEIIRRITGEDLDTLADRMIFTPLGMSDSTLNPAKFDKERIVPTEYRPDGTLVWAEPHDEKAHVALKAGIQSGLAGLFATVPDIMRWVRMIFDDGLVEGRRFLSQQAIARMTQDYYPEKKFRSALGWGDDYTFQTMNGIGGARLLVKGGFTGCLLVGDMETKKALVFLSNRVYPKRAENIEPWRAFRRRLVRNYFEA